MFKLIKYQVKGRYKFILGLAAGLILWNLFLLIRVNIWHQGSPVAASFGVGIVVLIAIVIEGIKIFSSELYGDTGYLLFTLPQRGYNIIGSKLIFSLTEFIVFILLAGLLLYMNINFVPGMETTIIKNGISQISTGIIYGIIFTIAHFIVFLILAYFSLALSKTVLGNKKYGKLAAFGMFLIILWIIEWIKSNATSIFPQAIKLHEMNISGVYMNINISIPGATINIASLVINIIIYLTLFILTSYMIDNKVDM